MTAFEKEGKIPSLNQNSGRKSKLSDRDHWTLIQIVRKDHKNAWKITEEFNDHLENPVSSKTPRKELHKDEFHRSCNQKTILK